jgi:hypothetical protein
VVSVLESDCCEVRLGADEGWVAGSGLEVGGASKNWDVGIGSEESITADVAGAPSELAACEFWPPAAEERAASDEAAAVED